jgi:hypothetical protein
VVAEMGVPVEVLVAELEDIVEELAKLVLDEVVVSEELELEDVLVIRGSFIFKSPVQFSPPGK